VGVFLSKLGEVAALDLEGPLGIMCLPKLTMLMARFSRIKSYISTCNGWIARVQELIEGLVVFNASTALKIALIARVDSSGSSYRLESPSGWSGWVSQALPPPSLLSLSCQLSQRRAGEE
jgi:hypothetical protein